MSKIDKQLVVSIVGDATQLKSTYDSVIKDSQRFGKEVEKNGISLQAVGKVMMAVGGTITAAMAGTVIAVTKSAGEIEHLSRVAGVNTESFQKLAYAAKQDDVDLQSLSAGMTKLAKNMDAAANGSDTTAEAFKSIGVGVVDTNGKLRSTDAVLVDVADKFAKLNNPAEKTALAIKLFGKSGADLVPFLEQGKDGIKGLGDEAEKLGLVLSNAAVNNLDALGDELDNVKAGIGGFGNQIASDLAPYLLVMTDGLKDVIKWVNQIPGPIRQAITTGVALGGVVALLTGAITVFGGAVWTALAPLLPFIAAATALGVAATVVYQNWNQVAAFLMTVWDKVVAACRIAWSGIRLYILTEIEVILKGLQAFTGWIPGWGDKLKNALASVESQMHSELNNINQNAISIRKNRYQEHYTWMVAHNKKKNQEIQKDEDKAAENRNAKTKEQLAKEKQAAEERVRLEKEWADKLFELTHNSSENLKREEEKALGQSGLTEKAKADIRAYYEAKRVQLAETEAKKVLEIQKDLDRQLYELTHTEYENQLHDLERFEQKELAQENLTADQKLQIKQIYQLKRKQLEDSENQKIQQRQKQLENRLYKITHTELQNRLKDLKTAEKQELEQLNLNEKEKADIVKYYAELRRQTYYDEEQTHREVYLSMAAEYVDYLNQLAEGETTLKEIIKSMVIDWINPKEEMTIADGIAGIAKAWAEAGGNPYIALPMIAPIVASTAAAVAGWEVAKATVRGLATGGLVTGPTLAVIGEGEDKEAVLPLNENVFAQLAAGIMTQFKKDPVPQTILNQSTNNSTSNVSTSYDNRRSEVHLHIGTLIADDASLKKLNRELERFRIAEQTRRGG